MSSIVNISEDAAPNSSVIRIQALDTDIDANLVYFLIKNDTSSIRAFDENNNQIDSDILIVFVILNDTKIHSSYY